MKVQVGPYSVEGTIRWYANVVDEKDLRVGNAEGHGETRDDALDDLKSAILVARLLAQNAVEQENLEKKLASQRETIEVNW